MGFRVSVPGSNIYRVMAYTNSRVAALCLAIPQDNLQAHRDKVRGRSVETSPFPNPQRNVVHEALPLRLLGTTALGSEAPETRKSWLAISRPFLPGPAEFGFGAGKAWG